MESSPRSPSAQSPTESLSDGLPERPLQELPTSPGRTSKADPLQAALRRHLKPDPGPSLRHRAGRGQSSAPAKQEWAVWLIGPALFGSGIAAALLVRSAPQGMFPWAIGIGVVLVIGWIAACALFPAKADRTCPACKSDALERLDPQSHRGLLCSHCGWTDESASSFFLAEEEGTLEEVVLLERARRRSSLPLGASSRNADR